MPMGLTMNAYPCPNSRVGIDDRTVAGSIGPEDEIRVGFEPVTSDAVLTQERLLQLSVPEFQEFKCFKIEKRKQDWLAGRIAAKKVVQDLLFRKGLSYLDLPAIQISKSSTGRPVVFLTELLKSSSSSSFFALKTLDISISHSNQKACATAVQSSPIHNWNFKCMRRIGIDLEKMDPLDPAIIPIALTDHEQSQIETMQGEPKISAFYAIWTAKEALLKALDLGLSVDLLELEVKFVKKTGRGLHNCPHGAKVRFRNREYPVEFEYLEGYILSSCVILSSQT